MKKEERKEKQETAKDDSKVRSLNEIKNERSENRDRMEAAREEASKVDMAIKETKNEIVKCLQKSGLPASVCQLILENVMYQVMMGSRKSQ